MATLLIRFLLGGVIVTAFSLVGEVIWPKSLAGVFSAAPSVALATLLLTVRQNGRWYAAAEGRAMVWGAIAFLLYACCCFALLVYRNWTALRASSASMFVWLLSAFVFWFFVLR
ncbi:MAG TPA: DUF3147 family protein [Verrucomicrobiae bacterium]|jgi:Protein of unknown function (DUF3147)|nr:DUF3147 family protein [Verrucomicrobiae bacterium]